MWRDSNESRGLVPLLAHKHYIEFFLNFSYRFRGKLYRDNYRYRIIELPALVCVCVCVRARDVTIHLTHESIHDLDFTILFLFFLQNEI